MTIFDRFRAPESLKDLLPQPMGESLMNLFRPPKNELESGGRRAAQVHPDENEPETACPNCHKTIPLSQLWGNDHCCPFCDHHFRMNARQRIAFLVDPGSFEERFAGLTAQDSLAFPGYREKLEKTRAASGESEAVVCGTARFGGASACLFVMEPYFMMGSMGVAVGEKIAQLFELATDARLPVVGFTASGGARMQEGLLSLTQMARTSAAVKRHSEAGLFYLAALTDPTMGGVSASFAMQGDIILAEPGASIGFAGARVIEQTTRGKLPQGFQTAEFLLKHGFVDRIAPRREQKALIALLLRMHAAGEYNEVQHGKDSGV